MEMEMEMTFKAIFNRCSEDGDYPAYMQIQAEVKKDLKKTQKEAKAFRKARNYYARETQSRYERMCAKYYELEIEMYKRLIEFNEKLIAMEKLNSKPKTKYRVA